MWTPPDLMVHFDRKKHRIKSSWPWWRWNENYTNPMKWCRNKTIRICEMLPFVPAEWVWRIDLIHVYKSWLLGKMGCEPNPNAKMSAHEHRWSMFSILKSHTNVQHYNRTTSNFWWQPQHIFDEETFRQLIDFFKESWRKIVPDKIFKTSLI